MLAECMLGVSIALLLQVAPSKVVYRGVMEAMRVPEKIYDCYFCVGFWISLVMAAIQQDFWLFPVAWVSICIMVPLAEGLRQASAPFPEQADME